MLKRMEWEAINIPNIGQLDEWDGRDSNTYDSATFSLTEFAGFNSGEFACWDLGYVRLQTDSVARHSSC